MAVWVNKSVWCVPCLGPIFSCFLCCQQLTVWSEALPVMSTQVELQRSFVSPFDWLTIYSSGENLFKYSRLQLVEKQACMCSRGTCYSLIFPVLLFSRVDRVSKADSVPSVLLNGLKWCVKWSWTSSTVKMRPELLSWLLLLNHWSSLSQTCGSSHPTLHARLKAGTIM